MSEAPSFRLLIIDDNPAIHLDFIKILKKEYFPEFEVLKSEIFGNKNNQTESADSPALPNFEIDVASQGQEGVKKIEEALQQGRHYSLAFVDIRMPPGWDGIETIKHIWELDKDIQIVICTAYSDYSWEETVEHLGKTDNLLILKKPFDNVSVRQLACALTRKWQLAEESRLYTRKLKQQVADRTFSLQQSLSLVKSTFESSSDGILVVNNNGKIIDYNHKLVEMFDIPQDVLDEKEEIKLLIYLKDVLDKPEIFVSKLSSLSRTPEKISIDTLELKNGKILECYSQPHELNNQIIGRILDFRDITKRAKLEADLKHQATHDSLTGLANRVKLMEKVKEALKDAEENGTQFAVLFMDFDRFKLVNDSLSHIVGDELLIAASKRLETAIEKDETLARLGGDEFVILFLNGEKETDFIDRIKNLITVFQNPFEIGERKITLTASIGVSFYPKDGKTFDVLLRNADAAMYHAKAQKGNNFQIYTPEMNQQSLEELDKEADIRQALINGEFFLKYQPQINLHNEKLEAVEALIRWQHPKKGVLLPIDFIPLAEETGLIIPISEWVMREACAQNKRWQDEGYAPIRVALNVTVQQFKQGNLVAKVRDILKETGLKPEYLELELTENVILSNREIVNIVTELKKLGVIIAIDDFGTGYSSLSYLHKIPLDRLKIDSSFIQHIKATTDDEVIIRAVIAMAKNLDLDVLTEGVETRDQLNFLKKYECGDVQGFYFSQPLTADELEKYFKNPTKSKTISHLILEKK